jgi:hypothetical protein
MDLDHIFNFHAPTDSQHRDCDQLRASAKNFAAAIVARTPDGADQTAAVRKVREALMTANAAILLDGKL